MARDLELGRAMEIDALLTVPLQLARELGVATPTLDLFDRPDGAARPRRRPV